MAKYSRIEVATAMIETGLVPLFYHPDVEIGKQILKACHSGGAKVVEFTNRGDFAHEVFGSLCRYANTELPGLMLGAGSVPDAATAALFIQLGANFIVSPSLREDIAPICNRRKILWSPGCGSLSEIGKAEELGCEIVKLFPGGTLGPSFVKAILGPQPWTRIMPTGGVSPTRENLELWFQSGVACAGMGSKLISKEIISNKDWSALSENIQKTLDLIDQIRKK